MRDVSDRIDELPAKASDSAAECATAERSCGSCRALCYTHSERFALQRSAVNCEPVKEGGMGHCWQASMHQHGDVTQLHTCLGLFASGRPDGVMVRVVLANCDLAALALLTGDEGLSSCLAQHYPLQGLAALLQKQAAAKLVCPSALCPDDQYISIGHDRYVGPLCCSYKKHVAKKCYRIQSTQCHLLQS